MRRSLTCLLLLSLCPHFSTSETTPMMAQTYPTRNSLADFYHAASLPWDTLKTEGVPADVEVLVWACHSRERPAEATDPTVVQRIRAFLDNGGSLFLVGFAAEYANALGLEEARPARSDWFRIGYNDASKPSGIFDIGLRPTGSHPLFEGLTPDGQRDDVFFLAGSHHVNLENLLWAPEQLAGAKTLAYYARRDHDDALLTPDTHPILNLWTVGKGRVLGYGNNLFLEDFWFNLREANLHRFLRNVASFLGGTDATVAALPETPSRLSADDYMSPPMFPAVQPHSLERRFPGLPYIAHWGWHGQITYQRGEKESKPIEYYRQRLIDEPHRWGANLLEFYAPSMDQGYPFDWPEDDPIARPKAPGRYWGGEFDPNWSLSRARELFRATHDRDMTVQLFYHPNPVRGEGQDPYVDYCEYQAREMQNPLLYGWEGAHDGVGSEWWPADDAGRTMRGIWMYNPGSYRYSTSILDKTGPYYMGTWMCAFARSAGINACGYGDRWRYVYHPPLYLSYQADCRSMKPSTREWGGWANYGGGSTPDWLLRQVNDFCRDRLYLDSAIWWLGEPAATLREEDRPYVYGTSMDPMRCAVTTTMRAVGEDGYRARAMETVDGVQPQYACTEPYPQDTAFIQNNYFRVLRMGGQDSGRLQVDPLRLAYYHQTGRPTPAVELSSAFLSSRPLSMDSFEFEKGKVAVAIGALDGSSAEFKGAAEYGKLYRTSTQAASFPAELRYERENEFPQEVEVSFTAPAGRYDLEIHTLPVEYPSTMEVEVDGRFIGVYFPTPGDKNLHVLPVSLGGSGEHTLLLRVQKADTRGNRRDGAPGLAHAFDALLLRNAAPQCVVHDFPIGVGHLAVLKETVLKNPAGTYRQTRSYIVDNDSPMFWVEIESDAPQSTAWEVEFDASSFGAMVQVDKHLYRLPGKDGHPGLVIVRFGEDAQKMEERDGKVVLTTAKKTHSRCRLGLLIDDGLYSEKDLPELHKAFDEPRPEMTLVDGRASYTNKLNIPRVVVARIDNVGSGPYFVAETNADGESFWLVRGAQPEKHGDFLKLYLQAKGTAKVQAYGYIDGVVKPGYGCQYSLAIADSVSPGRCEVEVIKTGPFLFAPRVEFKDAFDTVRVNGKPWRYFDGQLVLLPNLPGRYVIEVEERGTDAPTLARTFLSVDSAEWSGNTLTLVTRAPHWWEGPLPGNIDYTAMLVAPGYTIEKVEGGEMIAWNEFRASEDDVAKMKSRGAMLRLQPGTTRIHFKR